MSYVFPKVGTEETIFFLLHINCFYSKHDLDFSDYPFIGLLQKPRNVY